MSKLPDVAAITNYGGAKSNYAAVEDPTTDEDAADRNNYVDDVASMTHTAIRAAARFTASSGTTSASLISHDAVWGNSTAVKPTLARTGTGVYTLTWPTSVNDSLAQAHTLALRYAFANIETTGAGLYATAAVTSVNVVTVRTYSGTTATDPSSLVVTAFVL